MELSSGVFSFCHRSRRICMPRPIYMICQAGFGRRKHTSRRNLGQHHRNASLQRRNTESHPKYPKSRRSKPRSCRCTRNRRIFKNMPTACSIGASRKLIRSVVGSLRVLVNMSSQIKQAGMRWKKLNAILFWRCLLENQNTQHAHDSA